MTSNIQRRILEHNSGLVKSTKNRILLEVIFMSIFKQNLKPYPLRKYKKTKKRKLIFGFSKMM